MPRLSAKEPSGPCCFEIHRIRIFYSLSGFRTRFNDHMPSSRLSAYFRCYRDLRLFLPQPYLQSEAAHRKALGFAVHANTSVSRITPALIFIMVTFLPLRKSSLRGPALQVAHRFASVSGTRYPTHLQLYLPAKREKSCQIKSGVFSTLG